MIIYSQHELAKSEEIK